MATKDKSSTTLHHLYEQLSQVESQIEERRVPRCVMITDLVGYTAFVDQHGDVAGRARVKRAEEKVTGVVHSLGGRILKGLGDGWLIVFADPNRAAHAAMLVQREFANEDSLDTIPIQIKAALDYGKLIDEEEDAFGNVVNLCSRLCDHCEGNQILLSENAYKRLDPYYQTLCEPMEELRLRGKSQQVRNYILHWEIGEGQGQPKDTRSGVIEVRWKTDHSEVSWVVTGIEASPLTSYDSMNLNLSEINRQAELIYSILNSSNQLKEPSGQSLRLEEAGKALFDLLLPEKIRLSVRKSTVRFLILDLDDNCIHLPWELLHDGEDFLCCRFGMGRFARTSQTSECLKRNRPKKEFSLLVLSDPTGDLPSAVEEAEELHRVCSTDHRVIIDWMNGRTVDESTVDQIGDYDVIHYCGHAEYIDHDPDTSGWVLSNGRMTAADLKEFAKKGKTSPLLVFNNACNSGKTDSWKEQISGWSYGLANAFLLAGCDHYVGTVSEVLDSHSKEFAETFYQRVIAGHPIGEAVRDSRLRGREESQNESLIWAQYVLYGNPAVPIYEISTHEFFTKDKAQLDQETSPSINKTPKGTESRSDSTDSTLTSNPSEGVAKGPKVSDVKRSSPSKSHALLLWYGIPLFVVLILIWYFLPGPPQGPDKGNATQNTGDRWDIVAAMIDDLSELSLEMDDVTSDDWTERALTVAFATPEWGNTELAQGARGPEYLNDLRAALGNSQRIVPVPRVDELNSILQELTLGPKHLTHPEVTNQVGKLLAARFEITLTASKRENRSRIHFTLSQYETRWTKTVLCESTEGFDSLIWQVVEKVEEILKERFPIKGRILAANPTIILNIGRLHGVQPGDVFDVFEASPQADVQETVYGEPIASLRVLETTEMRSPCEVMGGEGVEVGMRVRE